MRRILVLFSIIAFAPAGRADPELTAGEVLRRMLRNDAFGFNGSEVRMRMVLSSRDGSRRTRVFESLSRKDGDEVKSIVRFREPADVAGTAFLLIQHADREDEQYVWLPALRRTRRIVGRERQGSFMGSDFSYADLDQRDFRENASSRRMPDERLGQSDCYVIESTPGASSGSQYGKILVWVRKADHVPLRIKFFDRSGRLLKTMYSRRVTTMQGRPVIMESRMQNAQDGHSTDLVIESITFRNDVPADLFTPRSLERG